MKIRETIASDMPDLEALYPAAFPDEELRPLVRALQGEPADTLSLAAFTAAKLVGHIVRTRCHVDGSDATFALLGPLAVLPEHQRTGIGTALVETGVQRLRDEGVCSIYVLGDPAYYGRFGFVHEVSVAPPYELPEAWASAWQSLAISNGTTTARTAVSGTIAPGAKLQLTATWQRPELWAP